MKQLIKTILLSLKCYLNNHPKLRMKILYLLNCFPNLKSRLKRLDAKNHNQDLIFHIEGPEELTPYAKKVYHDLTKALSAHKEHH